MKLSNDHAFDEPSPDQGSTDAGIERVLKELDTLRKEVKSLRILLEASRKENRAWAGGAKAERRRFFDSLTRLARNHHQRIPSRVVELASLRRRIAPTDTQLPYLGAWPMDSEPIVYLSNLIMKSDRHLRILELGSGSSTSWLALALRANPNSGHLFTVDHLEHYLELTKSQIDSLGVDDLVSFIHAPIKTQEFGGKSYDWYDIAALSHIDNIDLLIIDGPPSSTGPDARFPAFPHLHASLNDGALICLDDTNREEEKEIIEQWKSQFSGISLIKNIDDSCLLRWDATH